MVFAKLILFVKKNWKIIGIVLVVFIITGMAKRLFGRLAMWWSIKNVSSDPEKIDYDFMAVSVHSAMYQGLFNMGENESAIIGFVNSLGSMEQFLTLCRKYALKYGKDLREQLRKYFNDKQYSKLNWK